MNQINKIISTFFDWLFYPFSKFDPVWGLLFISVMTGILMLLIFKKVSNQGRIRFIKDQIKAHILEMRLYNDNILFSFQALGSIFKWNLRYLGNALKPMMVLIIPVMIIMIQLSIRFDHRSLKQKEQCLVTVILSNPMGGKTVVLEVSDGIVIETPAMRIPKENKIYWRIKGESPGSGMLRFYFENNQITKNIVVDSEFQTLASRRVDNNWMKQFLYPGESSLPADSQFKEIQIHYPRQKLSILGMKTSWLVFFFIVSILSGFAMKGVFGVEI